MKTTFARLVLPLLFAAAFIAPEIVSAPPAGAVPPVTSNLRSDGMTAVYTYTYYEDTTLYAVDLASGAMRALSTRAYYPDVSDNLVVWQESGLNGAQLGGIDLGTNTTPSLPSPPGEQMKPAIYARLLVWVNHDPSNSENAWTIQFKNLASTTGPDVIATLPSDIADVGQPRIVGQHILWSIQRGDAGADNYQWQLWEADLGGQPRQIASGSGSDAYLHGYDIGGDLAVYATKGEIHVIDLGSPGTDDIVGNGYNGGTDGRYVFWSVTSSPAQEDILGYDVLTASHFVAISDGTENMSPNVANGVVVWLSAPTYSFSYAVQSRTIQALLPSAARSDPGMTSPDWFYFPETQHYLSFGFKNFWVKSGGLPVFGYPLTEEFTQGNYTVQYLERQRFEYHPEFVRTPYETELGLLGSEAATSAGLIITEPFKLLPATTTSDANCSYVAATGHRLCGGFKQYWQSHGLDFGDAGISYRESVALFGYPISEEFTDPVSGFTVQYFERAVFEFHPNNPDQYKVELRLLGSQRVQSIDW